MEEPDEYGWYTDNPYYVIDSYNYVILACVTNDGYTKICELDWWDDEYSWEEDGETYYDVSTCLDIYVKGTQIHVNSGDILKWRILDVEDSSSSAS